MQMPMNPTTARRHNCIDLFGKKVFALCLRKSGGRNEWKTIGMAMVIAIEAVA